MAEKLENKRRRPGFLRRFFGRMKQGKRVNLRCWTSGDLQGSKLRKMSSDQMHPAHNSAENDFFHLTFMKWEKDHLKCFAAHRASASFQQYCKSLENNYCSCLFTQEHE